MAANVHVAEGRLEPIVRIGLPRFGASGFAGYLRDLNAPAAWAGLTTFIWYAVGMVPVQIAVTGQFGLESAQISSWIFIIWLTGAISSIALSLVYRQPIPITSTIPGLIFMGTLGDSFSFSELVGANLMAGLVITGLGLFGLAGRILALLPMPLAMGMLGGSILGDVTRMVSATVEDMIVAGATVAGYLLGRLVPSQRVPPVALALVSGAAAVLFAQRAAPAPIAWNLPSLVVPEMAFSPQSFVAVSLPLVILSMGLGNVQGLGFLRGQGYQVPVNPVTAVLGLNSIVNTFFGGHAAIVSRNGMPIMASPEAGPIGGRYWANIIAATLTLLIALAAEPVTSLLGILPRGYVVALAGVAILPAFQNAAEQAFGGRLRFGAVVTFAIAATPFSVLGITSAFWALVGGGIASYVAERGDLLAHWRGRDRSDERRDPRIPVDIRPTWAAQVAGDRRDPLTPMIRNISNGGLLLRSDQQLEAGQQLELGFQLANGSLDILVRVDVRHVQHQTDGPVERWEAGCQFRDADPRERSQIVTLLLGRHRAAA